MPTIKAGSTLTFTIPAGQIVQTTGSGTAVLIPSSVAPISLVTTNVIGPFASDMQININADSAISYSIIGRLGEASLSSGSTLGPSVTAGGVTTPIYLGSHKLIAAGDSLTAQDFPSASGAYLQWLSNGLIANLNYKLYGRFNLVGVMGLSGNRSDQIAAALPSFLAANTDAGYIIIDAGANDVAQYLTAPRTVDDYRNSMRSMIDLCLSRGFLPIIRGITGSALFITTAGMADMWVACNRVLRDLARQYPQIILLPTDDSIINLAATYPAGLATLCDGSFHPNSRGALEIALDDFAILDKFIPPVKIFPSHWHAGSSNEMAYTGNPLMTGTQAASGGLTGNVPAAGVTISVGGTPISAVASLVQNTAAPIGSQWAKVAYQGPVSPAFATDFVRATTASVALSSGNFVAGDVIQGVWEFDVDSAPTSFMGAEIFINFIGATGVVQSPIGGPIFAFTRAYGMRQNAGVAPLTPLSTDSYGKGVLMTVPVPIPSGTTSIQLFAQAFPVVGVAGSNFNVYFGRNTYLKLD